MLGKTCQNLKPFALFRNRFFSKIFTNTPACSRRGFSANLMGRMEVGFVRDEKLFESWRVVVPVIKTNAV